LRLRTGVRVTLFFPEANVYKGAMKRSVRELAELIDARVMGDGTVEVSRVASLQSAAVGDLIFAEEEKNFALASQSLASAVIAGEFAAGSTSSRPVLICAQPRLAFARAARLFRAAGHHEAGVHPTAIVPSSVRAGTDVNVGAYVVLGQGVQIGDNTRIGAGCLMGANVVIGRDCELYPNVTVYSGVRIGDRVVVHAGAVLGSDGFGYVRIEEGAILGAQSGIPSKKIIRGKGVVFWGTPARPIREYLKQLAVLARLAKKE